MYNEFVLIVTILVSALMAAIAQYIFKRNIPAFHVNRAGILSLIRNKFLIGGIAVYAASLVVYLFALRGGQLSFVYPTFASVFVFVLVISKFSLGEKINIYRIIGVALIIAGIAAIAATY